MDISRWRKPPECGERNVCAPAGVPDYVRAMASTHLSLHYHLVFSTKDRIGMIAPAWRDRLHAFLGGVVKQLDGIPEAIGGVADHVHLLIGLGAMHRLADVMREIKSVSSRWVHDEIGVKLFSWQEGYGGFTVGAPQCPSVKQYIGQQEEHHRVKTYQEEYVDFLRRGGVEYDDRYLW